MTRNRLSEETSPYLLQHRDNPVHWWAWGPEALAEAKARNKPILLSVGYAACHWCHVMAHESFESEATAAVMNDHFINIKVDREERPDVDAIYMAAVHALGEHGGWPLTMFLAPDGRPFWGGTYFPPTARYGKPAFTTVLSEIAKVFRDNPEKIAANATGITAGLQARKAAETSVLLDDKTLANIALKLVSITDPVNGGVKGAPKFPQSSLLWLLWRAGVRYNLEPARTAVVNTLTHICQGGIYDHIGGGFARYSVDEHWLVPHFEKMLYDNALLIDLMTEVWRETQDDRLRRRVAETVDWLRREMIADGGGFAASLDADSDGEEGKFYVWDAAEITAVLGANDAAWFGKIYDVTPEGNFEGHTILNRLGSLELLSEPDEQRLSAMRAKLLAARAPRIRPGWDDKVLADWNGLMISALAHAARVFERPEWLLLAEQAFQFVTTAMVVNGRLRHSWRAGQLRGPATASDYANMIAAALRLHQVTNKTEYLAEAERLAATLDTHYWLPETGGYAFTADDTTDLIARLAGGHDDATPNANAVTVSNLIALFALTGATKYAARAEATLDAYSAVMARNLFGHTGLIAAAFDVLAPQHIVVVGEAAAAAPLTAALNSISTPGAILQHLPDTADFPTSSPLAGKRAIDGAPAAYVCIGPQCSPPATTAEDLLRLIRASRLQVRLADDAGAT